MFSVLKNKNNKNREKKCLGHVCLPFLAIVFCYQNKENMFDFYFFCSEKHKKYNKH